jgi:hypothetical protein
VPAIDRRIFKKISTSTPKTTSKAEKDLRRELSPGQRPIIVKVVPEPGAVTGECFHNVRSKVARDGGEILYGWTIWEWPQVFIEAEHHAVWTNGEELVDVTLPFSGERRTMFLPDPSRAYDYETKKRLLNVKRSLGVIPAAQRWIDASHRLQEFIEAHSDGDIITFDRVAARPLAEQVEQAHGEVLVSLAIRTKPNDPCFCGTTRKFRKCCGQMIDLNA